LDDKRSNSHPAEQKPRLTKNFQLLAIINGLSDAGLRIIGSDVVEFTPVYDNAAETTGIAVGQIVYEILQWMVKVPVKTPKAAAI
jgi:agmatinase